MYERTVALDLDGTEEEIFARIDKTARRHVRAPAKRGLELRPVTDMAFAQRIQALMQETFSRTGGVLHQLPWDRIVAWSLAEPRVSRVVGLFDPRTEGSDALISMAWGCAHGDYVTYEAGAGVRRADLGSTPVNYAPLWDLISWAKRDVGARWFDFGGASAGDEHDVLAGNLDFKRYFSEQIIPVADEWVLEPHVLRARLARAASAAASLARRLRR
jgi:lipid II:glycine glycyltransferase (peptidoglycan interpeptide bridge formation enzyme)